MKEYTASILKNVALGGRYCRLDLVLSSSFPVCKGGEFLMIACGYDEGKILRRPMAVLEQKDDRHLSVLYQVVGVGTQWLQKQVTEASIQFLGPLGNCFAAIKENEKIAVLAGGIGVAPFLAWTKQQNPAYLKNLYFYFGFRNQEESHVLEKKFKALGVDPVIWTDEKNSTYPQGLVMDALKSDMLQENHALTKIYTCGPNVMMKAVHDWAKPHAIPVFASAEAKMACGMGVCLSCVVETSELPIGERKLVCKDGPVLELH